MKKIVRYSMLCLSLCTITMMDTVAQYTSGVTLPDSSYKLVEDPSIDRIKYANTISAEDLRSYLSVLASDEYEGRETGEPGNYKAAAYIAGKLTSLGYPEVTNEGYYQSIAFSFSKWEETELSVRDTTYRFLWDYLAFPSLAGDMQYEEDEIIFLGYGIDDSRYSDYRGKNVEGKTIMIYEGEPKSSEGLYWISGKDTESFWSETNNKLKIAQRKGVRNVIVIKNDIKAFLSENRRLILGSVTTLGNINNDKKELADHIYVSSDVAKRMLGDKIEKVVNARNDINKKGKSKSVKVKSNISFNFQRRVNVLSGYNVMGFLEGRVKPEEIIIVSAHYDHVGKTGEDVYNGADDNGSGTSTVLELAEAMMKAKKDGNGPERSILFLWVTGEEKGLLGSAYYAKNPIFPLANTVADVNIDMVGRVDKKYEAAGNPNYIYVIGSDRLSKDLHDINEEMNKKYTQVTLDYTFNDAEDPNRFYFRSDHYNFAKNRIPAIFFFNGVHDDYHRTSDTVDKINFQKMEKIGKLIFQTTWELANRKNRIRLNGIDGGV